MKVIFENCTCSNEYATVNTSTNLSIAQTDVNKQLSNCDCSFNPNEYLPRKTIKAIMCFTCFEQPFSR